MNKTLAFAALLEVITGVALLAVPSLSGRLLLGTELSGVAVAGIRTEVIDLTFRDPQSRSVVPATRDLKGFNPGYTL